VVGRPYTTAGGKNARVRVQRVGEPAVTALRTCGAHERIAVKRALPSYVNFSPEQWQFALEAFWSKFVGAK
jgi:hypothetical protein